MEFLKEWTLFSLSGRLSKTNLYHRKLTVLFRLHIENDRSFTYEY